MGTWFIGIWTFDNAAIHPWVDALATKATITSANITFALGTSQLVQMISTVGPVATRGTPFGGVFTQVTVKGPLGLAWKGKSIQFEGLATNRTECNGTNRLRFIFSQLHGLKDNGKAAALKQCL
jgi:hypothetical protein